jgi:16S rRNA (uracil1498-N3)-methyltransferase
VSAPVFLVDPSQLDGDVVALTGAEGRHAAVVQRLAVGEHVDLTDGAGTVAACEVVESAKSGLMCRVLSRRYEAAPAPRFVAVQALPKGDRGERAVEMLTEVGVDEIVPWAASRCVTRWKGERGEKALSKWRSSAREATKQSRRAWVPTVSPLASTADVAALLSKVSLALVLHAPADTTLSELDLSRVEELAVVVGPEGGVTDDELEKFAEAGARRVRLGPSVLRTSTAGVAAMAVLMSRTRRWA